MQMRTRSLGKIQESFLDVKMICRLFEISFKTINDLFDVSRKRKSDMRYSSLRHMVEEIKSSYSNS